MKGGTSIPAGADLKSAAYLVPGNYYCSSNALISGFKNCPVNKAFVLKVDYSTGTANYIRQKFIEYDTERTISRVYDSSASGWLQNVESVSKSDLRNIIYSGGVTSTEFDHRQDSGYYILGMYDVINPKTGVTFDIDYTNGQLRLYRIENGVGRFVGRVALQK